MMDTEDPIVASYNVFLTKPGIPNQASNSSAVAPSPKVMVLQYPAFRPSSKPYNTSRSQRPSELRLKPNTGLVEIDVPIITHENYNSESGARFGKAISDSKNLYGMSAHGLAGGFHTGSAQAASLRDLPTFDAPNPPVTDLDTQTLGGKITSQNGRDPIYFLATVKDGSIHLSRLDGVVQVRPQLHHLDAEEELSQKRFQANSAQSGVKLNKPGAEPGPSKLESRAIEVKLKDNKEEARDRTMNENAKLLREIQSDSWQSHQWIGQDQQGARTIRQGLSINQSGDVGHIRLKSALNNGDWLDKMSAPRENGKKGLLAKLRGRERERARRKKAEEEKKLKSKEANLGNRTGAGPILAQSSDSEDSSGDATDTDINKATNDTTIDLEEDIDIKEEPEVAGKRSGVSKGAALAEVNPGPVRRRGRPKKIPTTTPIELDD